MTKRDASAELYVIVKEIDRLRDIVNSTASNGPIWDSLTYLRTFTQRLAAALAEAAKPDPWAEAVRPPEMAASPPMAVVCGGAFEVRTVVERILETTAANVRVTIERL